MAEIPWHLAVTPNFIGNALQSYERGQQRGLEVERRNALQAAAMGQDDASINRLLAVDPEAGMRFRQMRQQDQQAQARKQAAQQYSAGDMSGAQNTALGAGDFELVQQFQAMTKEERAETQRKAQLGTSIGLSLKNVPQEQRQAQLQAMLPQLQAQGLTPEEIAGIPLDDAGIEAGLGLAMSASDILSKMDRDRTFSAGREDEQWNRGMEGQKFDWTRQVDGARLGNERARLGLEAQRVAISQQDAATNAAGVDKATRTTEANLRKEFNALPDVKNYRTVATQAEAVKRLAAAPPSANNDIAMVYAVMKSYDPTSVVRETEFATAQNAAGVPDTVRNQWNKLLNGQRLNPKQRQEMAQTVGQFANTYRQRFDTVASEYRSYAGDYGADPDRVVTVPAPQPSASAPAGPAPKGVTRGKDGNFYAQDPTKPGSFPQARRAPDGNWYLKAADGSFYKVG